MSIQSFKSIFQLLIHEQNNELSKIVMHLENALDDKNFEEVKSALSVFDSYNELTQKYSRFAKKVYSEMPVPVVDQNDRQLLFDVLKELYSKKKKELQLDIKISSKRSVYFSEVFEVAWAALNDASFEIVKLEFDPEAKKVYLNSIAFDLKSVGENGI